jgi:hypothetical protein
LHRDGRVLEGWHRAKACHELGKSPLTRPLEGTDEEAFAFVVDLNLRRRHLRDSRRAMLAARLETTTHGGARRGDQHANLHLARASSARICNAKIRSVADAATVLKRGTPEVIAAVDGGDFAVSRAAKIAKLPPERQASRLERDQRKERGESRQEHGFYRTPEETTRAVVVEEKLPKKVCEPCCGDGVISRVLEALGHEVISSDKYDRGYGVPGRDFLEETEKQAECMMTNPPFDDIDKIVQHALDLGYTKIIVQVPLTWLAGM